jgi:hypothetical protein
MLSRDQTMSRVLNSSMTPSRELKEGSKNVKKAYEWLDTDENCEGANCTGQAKEGTDTS